MLDKGVWVVCFAEFACWGQDKIYKVNIVNTVITIKSACYILH